MEIISFTANTVEGLQSATPCCDNGAPWRCNHTQQKVHVILCALATLHSKSDNAYESFTVFNPAVILSGEAKKSCIFKPGQHLGSQNKHQCQLLLKGLRRKQQFRKTKEKYDYYDD